MPNENPYEAPPPSDCADIVQAEFSCPKCGGTCEKGLVHALGSISWFPETASFHMLRPEKISAKGFALESKLKAIRCPECEHIIIDTSTSD